MTSRNLEVIYKIILLGDSYVGKTSFLHRLIDNEIPSYCPTTIGVDFKVYVTRILNQDIKTYIWDTAGQENFRCIVSSYYRDAIGAMVFFDLGSQKSLQACDTWIGDLVRERAPQPCRVLVVGNKTDIPNSEKLSSVEIANYIQRLKEQYQIDIRYCEISAKEGIGIHEAMDIMIRDIYQTWPIHNNVYPVGIRIEKRERQRRFCQLL
jgi:small GTP-binding protein